MAYKDTVLIKLRRDYSKDEAVMFALNEVKRLKVELGKNNAYIDELKETINQLNKDKKDSKKLVNTINDLKKTIGNLIAKNNNYEKL
jgi:seryl-tRNA synthetase